MTLTKEELKGAHNNVMTIMENRVMAMAGCDRKTANLIANEILDLDREAEELLKEEEPKGDYKFFTTFLKDFLVADELGESAIFNTYERIFGDWKTHYKYLTELVIVLYSQFLHYSDTNESASKMYYSLWEEAKNYAYDNLEGDEFEYFLKRCIYSK